MAAQVQGNRWRPASNWTGVLIALGIIVLLVAGVAALLAWLDDDEASVRGVTVADIHANPQAYYGEDTVTVSGEVDRVLSPFAYTIGGEAFGGQELLVVGPPPAVVAEDRPDDPLLAGDIVQVTGEVRPFDVDEVAADVGADLDDERLAAFVGQPVVIAAGTTLTPRTGAMRGEPTSVEEILAEPEEWFSETVTVSGEVVRVLGSNLFVFVGEEGNQILVVDATEDVAGAAAVEADVVQVSGPVVPFELAAIEAQTEINLSRIEINLDDAAVAEIPVGTTIVAWAIHIVA